MSTVNYITHLNGVMRKFHKDPGIGGAHRNLYLAFFQMWNKKHFPEKLMVNSKLIMSIAKLRSRTTYLKLLQELVKLGYIEYYPSNNPQIGSTIKLFRYDTDPEQIMNSASSISNALSVHNMVPFNKRKMKTIKNSFKQTRPENDHIVLDFFKMENRSLLKAEKFYNFYEAIGWRLSGNPIVSWRACAKKWIIKADKIKKEQTPKELCQIKDNLRTSKSKDYGKPL
jgi:hypothetical protein